MKNKSADNSAKLQREAEGKQANILFEDIRANNPLFLNPFVNRTYRRTPLQRAGVICVSLFILGGLSLFIKIIITSYYANATLAWAGIALFIPVILVPVVLAVTGLLNSIKPNVSNHNKIHHSHVLRKSKGRK